MAGDDARGDGGLRIHRTTSALVAEEALRDERPREVGRLSEVRSASGDRLGDDPAAR